ncbi:hypothetical protein LXL04_035801 [Taraxacum kok-saghyz]
MDSSNSGSFQSSSGGAGGGDTNEEYDSRTPSISSFLNPPTHFNPNLNHLLQPLSSSSHHNHRPPPSFFDPSSSSNPVLNTNTLQDLGSVWAGTNINPDRNIADFHTYPINPNQSTMEANTKAASGGSDHHHNQVPVKNPKKRTRASRRAPTTVLTTDTTNFRQMVQEFTGIPTAPFTSAPFSRRLDLFGRVGDGGGGGSMYPLRPSVQKIQPQQQPSFLNSTTNIVESGNSNNITAATTSSNYQLPPSEVHEFQKQPSTLLDLQNPMLSFQSLLQSTLPQQSNHLSGGFHSSSKRWRGQDEKLESFEELIGNTQNIGGTKLNSGLENVVVSSRNGGDQVQGNEDSWGCPSN